jgi:MFS family permease
MANNQPPTTPTRYPPLSSIGHLSLLGPVAAGLIGSLFLRLSGAAASASIALYLRGLSDAGQAISPLLVGMLAATFFIVELAFSPVLGGLSDRIGRRPLLVFGPLIGIVGSQIFPFTSFIPLLFVGQALIGLSTAATLPTTLSLLTDITANSPQRTRIMGYYEVASLIGIAAGIAGATAVWDTLGHVTFHILLLFYLASMLVFGLGLREVQTHKAQKRTWKEYGAILSSAHVLRFVPAWIAINAVLGLWNTHMIFQLYGASRNIGQALMGGFSSGTVSQFYLAYILAFTIGIYAATVLIQWVRRTKIMRVALVGLLTAALWLWMLNHFPALGLPPLGRPILFGLFLVSVFVASWFTPIALAYLADSSEFFPSSRGVVMGLYAIFLGLGQIIGSSLGGVFTEAAGMDGLLLLTVLLGIVAAGNVIAMGEV